VGALEEASWLLEDLAGKKFWQLQSEAELRGEIEADIADEQIKEAKEARG
jgi:pantothenate kinase-related protein Tda10